MNSDYSNPLPRTGSFKRTMILVLLAFLLGLGAMGWAATRWGPARDLLFGPPAPQPVTTAAPPLASPDLQAAAPTVPLASEKVEERIAELESRLARVGTAGGSASARAEGLLIAFAARRAIDRGLSLGYLEGALQEQFGMSQPRAVGVVIATARQPVTLDALKDELNIVGPKLVSRSPDKGWMESVRDSFSSLIIVRQAGSPPTNPVDRLARAQRMIDAGRVDVALTEVARLPGASAAATWMQSARRLVEAHRALDVLEASAIMQPGSNPVPKSLPPITPKDPALRDLTTPETRKEAPGDMF